ncbi:50S ribosomal protein L25/general stress protein Ctc [soil metagenome]
MATARETLKVAERTEFGSRTARRMRRDGLLLGVVYSGGNEARPFQVSEREARVIIARGGALLDVEFAGGDTVPAVVKEQQRHPVRDQWVHIDLLEVDLKQAIQADVEIVLVGIEDAPGVKNDGGVLEHITRELTVEALPTAIPESIEVDVSAMEINDTIQLSAVTAPEGVEFVLGEDAEELTIATLSPPRVEEEPEPDLEVETELIGEEGEAPEGEAGDDSGDSGDSGGGDSGDDSSGE